MAYLVPHGGGKSWELRHHMLIGTRKDCDVFLNPGSNPACYLARVHIEEGERWLEVLERGEVQVNGVTGSTLDLEEKALVEFPSLRLRFWFTTEPAAVEMLAPEPTRPGPIQPVPARLASAQPAPVLHAPAQTAPVIHEREVSTLWRDRVLEPSEVAETLVVPRSRPRAQTAAVPFQQSSPEIQVTELLDPTVVLPRAQPTLRLGAAVEEKDRVAPAPETLVFVPRASRPPPPKQSPRPPAAPSLQSLVPVAGSKPTLPWWGALLSGFLLALGAAFLMGRLG